MNLAKLKHHQYVYTHRSFEPLINLEGAKRLICPHGKVVVAIWPELERTTGGIYLADQTKNDLKPDIGTVVAHGTDELEIGQHVFVKSGAGKCVEGLWTGSWGPLYRYEDDWECCETRMYGRAGGATFDEIGDPVLLPFNVPWWAGVIALTNENEEIKPLGKNILVKFSPMKTSTASGILLHDDSAKPDSLVTLLAVGPKVEEVMAGDKAYIHEGDVTRFVGQDTAIVPEESVYMIVR